MTAARWARPSLELDHESKLDRAISAGFDPGEDYGCEPAPGPITPAMARVHHQGSTGCAQCGERCERCDERMCSTWGPEPRVCGVTCGDCPCACTACDEAAQDRQDERAYEIAREER